ncbi:hypothetical protein AL492_10015 [Elizabethkingia anophelis]|nr:hypothetical protein AL491_07605 [Elizabethkingia anophelis]AVF51945.1 hypothetical protein AL492_10015 [Elizabethkingia anophelis]
MPTQKWLIKDCCSGVEVIKMTEKKLQKSFVNREKVFIFALANLKRLTEEFLEEAKRIKDH